MVTDTSTSSIPPCHVVVGTNMFRGVVVGGRRSTSRRAHSRDPVVKGMFSARVVALDTTLCNYMYNVMCTTASEYVVSAKVAQDGVGKMVQDGVPSTQSGKLARITSEI